jgi:hypothetical protein
MLLVWLALLSRSALAAEVQVLDFRIRWLLHQESGGIEQLEQWNVSCNQSKCQIGRWISGRDFGQRSVPLEQAKGLLASAESLPTATTVPTSQAMRASHHEERIWVDRPDKGYAKVRPQLPENEDMSSGLAWARFELDLRHAWEGRDR